MTRPTPLRAAGVIDAFGGPTKTARALGFPITTVQSWKEKDRIPHWHLLTIRLAAAREGVALPEEAREQPPAAEAQLA